MVHGDICERNIIFSADGVLLIDFGNAFYPADEKVHGPCGTYMSFSNLSGALVTWRDDMYALGIMLDDVRLCFFNALELILAVGI